jgi:ribosomal protein S4
MENKNEIIIEVEQVAPVKAKKGRKPKNPDAKPKERTEAQKEAQRNYYLTKLKNDPEYQAKQRESSKRHYYKHQELVKEKVRNYKKEKKELELLERLYEMQQERMLDEFYGDELEGEAEANSNAEELIIKKMISMGLDLDS